MSCPRCKAVFPRDSLTAKTLQKWPIPVFDLGNPMMDYLEPLSPRQLFHSSDLERQEQERLLTIILLPGSRPPEVYANWEQILVAVAALIDTFSGRTLRFLGAIAPWLSLEPLYQILLEAGFKAVMQESELPSQSPDPEALTFSYKNALDLF